MSWGIENITQFNSSLTLIYGYFTLQLHRRPTLRGLHVQYLTEMKMPLFIQAQRLTPRP